MKTIYLLRHGAYDAGTEVLNARGIKQIEAVTAHLEQELGNPVIFSSKGPRAQQTAAMLVNHFSTNLEVVDWLEKPQQGESLDIDLLWERMQSVGEDQSLVLVTSGEFIHQFVTGFSEKRGISHDLKPLVKGEVMLCKLGESIGTVYF